MSFDLSTVYGKTGKGAIAVNSKSKDLPSNLMRILALVDGKSSIEDILAANSKLTDVTLNQALFKLANEGYIKVLRTGPSTVFALGSKGPSTILVGEADVEEFFAAQKKMEAISISKANQEIDERARNEAVERLLQEADEKSRAEAEELARLKAEEIAREAAAFRFKIEAEHKARREAAAKAKIEADKKAEILAKAKARMEENRKTDEEAQAREIAAAIAIKEAARKAREEAVANEKAEAEASKEAERKAREEAASLARVEAEKRKRIEAEEQARAKADEEARLEAERIARAEAEAQARAEAEARKEAERKVREVAEALARAQAEERKRIEAEEQARTKAAAEAQARAEAEERARIAAEEQARAKAAEEARLEAERIAREEAEAQARAEAEERARIEAEEQARAKAAEEARPEAERIAREEAEAQARAEAEERARIEAEEQARAKAAEEARKEAERIAREEAAAIAKAATEERKRLEAEEKARAKAEKQAHKEAEAKAREEAKAEAKAQKAAEKELRAQAKIAAKAQSMAETRGPESAATLEKIKIRKPRKPFKISSTAQIALALLFLAPLVLLHVVSLNIFAPSIAKLASDRIHEPVMISSVRASLWPAPHLRLEGITIGNLQDVKIATVRVMPALTHLFDETRILKLIEVESLATDQNSLRRVSGWLGSGSAVEKLQVERIQLKDTLIDVRGMQLPLLNMDVHLAANSTFKHALISSADNTINIDVLPKGETFDIKIVAKKWQAPIALKPTFDELTAKATATRAGMSISDIEGRLYGGSIKGTATVNWDDRWNVAGDFQVSRVDLESATPALSDNLALRGRFDAKATYTMEAKTLAGLFDAPRIKANFNSMDGAIGNVDLSGATIGQKAEEVKGGQTKFTRFNGTMTLVGNRYQFRQMKLESDTLKANGEIDVLPNKELSGSVNVEMRLKSSVYHSRLSLAGTLKQPSMRR